MTQPKTRAQRRAGILAQKLKEARVSAVRINRSYLCFNAAMHGLKPGTVQHTAVTTTCIGNRDPDHCLCECHDDTEGNQTK